MFDETWTIRSDDTGLTFTTGLGEQEARMYLFNYQSGEKGMFAESDRGGVIDRPTGGVRLPDPIDIWS